MPCREQRCGSEQAQGPLSPTLQPPNQDLPCDMIHTKHGWDLGEFYLTETALHALVTLIEIQSHGYDSLSYHVLHQTSGKRRDSEIITNRESLYCMVNT